MSPKQYERKMRKIAETAENPIIRELAHMLCVADEVEQELSANTEMGRTREEFDPMIWKEFDEAIAECLQELHAIPEDVWKQWCGAPKDWFITEYASIFYQYMRKEEVTKKPAIN